VKVLVEFSPLLRKAASVSNKAKKKDSDNENDCKMV
jgi:hypothetical protein